ncbi:MAG: type VI secretion system tube protein TssD [Sandaracinaceae bacterium]
MGLNAYMTIEGDTSGLIEGSSTASGHEGQIEVNAYTHVLSTEVDAASGLPIATQHHDVSITKPTDAATVPLYAAFSENEALTVVIRFYQPLPSGAEVNMFTVQLEGAYITTMEAAQLNNTYLENAILPPFEVVQLRYDRITWTWEDGAVSGSDTRPPP